MKHRLTNYLQKLGGFYQVRNGKEYKRFLTEVQKRDATATPVTTVAAKLVHKNSAAHTSLDHMGQGINEGGLEDDEDEIFIPYVTIPRIEDSIFFVIEVNNGSANHTVRRTLKQFAKFDDQVCCHPLLPPLLFLRCFVTFEPSTMSCLLVLFASFVSCTVNILT